MLRNFEFIYNKIDEQDLKTAYELTIEAWNDIINILRTQTNTNTTYIETLNEWFLGGTSADHAYTDDLGSYKSFYDLLMSKLSKLEKISKDYDRLISTYIPKTTLSNILYGTDNNGNTIAIPQKDIKPDIIKRYTHYTDFPSAGELGRFYISEYDSVMYYWDGIKYQRISNGDEDFDVIDGGNADEYEYSSDIIDGGEA